MPTPKSDVIKYLGYRNLPYRFVLIYRNDPSLREQLLQLLPQIISQRDLREHSVQHPQFTILPEWPDTNGLPLQLQVEQFLYEDGKLICIRALVIDISFQKENKNKSLIKLPKFR